MTTLAANIDAAQGYIPNTEDEDELPSGFYTLDSEMIRVRAEFAHGRSNRGNGQLSVTGRQVDRAIAGTTAAAHSAGTTLTRVNDPSAGGGGSGGVTVTDGTTTVDPATSIHFLAGTISDLGGGVAGVGVVPTLLGPLHFAHDDAGIGTNGVVLASDLPAGTWLLSVDVFITEDFDGLTTDNYTCDIGLQAGASPIGSQQIGWSPTFDVSLTTVGQVDGSGILKPHGSGYYNFRRVALTQPGILMVYFVPDGVNTQGEADVYALIVSPA
jgi:hypothetical protein